MLKKYDRYGHTFGLTLKGNDSHATWLGFSLTLFQYAITIYFGIISFTLWYTIDNNTTSTSPIMHSTEESSWAADEIQFDIGFLFYDKNHPLKFYD
jgi:hypothetical protein